MTNSTKVFSGRLHELNQLREAFDQGTAFLAAIYGRRRVGKTRLVREFSKDYTLWEFDGLEKQSQAKQIRSFLTQLADYTNEPLYQSAPCKTWQDCFKLLDKAILKTPQKYKNRILFFDEFPYMAHGRSDIVSDLKWAWDNLWARLEKCGIILCGSVASFMVEKVIQSSALYGRISLEICLEPLKIPEVYDFFDGRKSKREILDLYMFCGGIPAYLELFKNTHSIHNTIAKQAFQKNGYFVKEFDRIFKETFKKDSIYRKIVSLLNKKPQLSALQIFESIGLANGSSSHRYLNHLENAGFIACHVPLDKPPDSRLKKYFICDEYILFYSKFIAPKLSFIQLNTNQDLFASITQSPSYKSWAGLAFERLCMKHASQIMSLLNIDQLVTAFGPLFKRNSATEKTEGVQIDLMFYRHDPVITICELKHLKQPVGKNIIPEFEKKLELLKVSSKTLHKVLVTLSEPTQDLVESRYFDRIILAEELFIP